MMYELKFKMYFVTRSEDIPSLESIERHLRSSYLPNNSMIYEIIMSEEIGYESEEKSILRNTDAVVRFKESKEMMFNRLKILNKLELLETYKDYIKNDGVIDYIIVFIGVI